MNTLRRALLVTTLYLFLIGFMTDYAVAAQNVLNPLVDVEAWTCFPAREAAINSVSGMQGFWVQRNYRLPGGALVHAIWMSGKGTDMRLTPEADISTNDGPLGSGSTYKTFSQGDLHFIFEDHPTLGKSLIVNIASNGILTLESTMATEQELIDTAEKLLR